jgi:hypothetical protein
VGVSQSSGILGRQEIFVFVGLPMMAITLGSREVMVFGPGSPGLRQSSATVTSPREERANQPVVGKLQEAHWPWEGSLFPANAPNVRKTPHTAHKGGSQEVSHAQSLISRLAG